MEATETPDDVGAVDADNLAVAETLLEDVGGTGVVVALVGGKDDQAVGDIEVGVAGGKPLPFVVDGRGHGQLDNSGLLAVGQAATVEGGEVLLQGLVVAVVFVALDSGDDGVGGDETAQVVDMTVGVVAVDAVTQPDDIVQSIVVAQITLDVGLRQLGVAVGIEQARGGGEHIADAVEVDAASLHDDARVEGLHAHALGDKGGDLVVEVGGVLAAPSVIVPVDDGTTARLFAVEEERRAVVATPCVVGGELVELEIDHEGAGGVECRFDQKLHGVVLHVDMNRLDLGEGLDKEVVGGNDGLYLAWPRVLVVRIAEPGGFVLFPFGREIISEFFRGHVRCYLVDETIFY